MDPMKDNRVQYHSPGKGPAGKGGLRWNRLFFAASGIVLLMFTFLVYGFVGGSGDGGEGTRIRTDNRDILAQIDELEEQKKISEEKMEKIENDVFLGKNTPVTDYAEGIISDLKKSAESPGGTEDEAYGGGELPGPGYEEPGERNYLEDLLSRLEEEDEPGRKRSERTGAVPTASAGGTAPAPVPGRRVASLFAFSNTKSDARIFNDGSGRVRFSDGPVSPDKNVNETGQAGPAGRVRMIYNENPVFTVFEGEFLEVVLVNRIVNNREPSPVEAVVTKDLLDETGEYVLIPANSRLTGEAGRITNVQDNRIQMGFHRLILPNGRSLHFSQPANRMTAMDSRGSMGVRGKKNTHFFSKFGSSLLFGSLNGIGGLAQNRISQDSGLSRFIDRTSDHYNTLNDRLASDALSILPTITVEAGTVLKVRFSMDIDISAFSGITERSYYRP